MQNENEDEVEEVEVDLSEMDEGYDEVKEPEYDGSDVPDGIYQAFIERCEFKISDNGNPYIAWMLRIICGKRANRCLFKHSMLTPEGQNKAYFKKDMGILGFQQIKPSQMQDPSVLEKLLDISVEVQQRTTSGKNEGDKPFINIYFKKKLEIEPIVVSNVEGGQSASSGAAGNIGDF